MWQGYKENPIYRAKIDTYFYVFLLTYVFSRVIIDLSKRKRCESVEGIRASERNKACGMLQDA